MGAGGCTPASLQAVRLAALLSESLVTRILDDAPKRTDPVSGHETTVLTAAAVEKATGVRLARAEFLTNDYVAMTQAADVHAQRVREANRLAAEEEP